MPGINVHFQRKIKIKMKKSLKSLKSIGLAGIIAASALTGCKQESKEIPAEIGAQVEQFLEKEIKNPPITLLDEINQEYAPTQSDPVQTQNTQAEPSLPKIAQAAPAIEKPITPLRWDEIEARRHDEQIVLSMNKVNRICGLRFDGYQPFRDIGLLRTWIATEGWDGLETIIDTQKTKSTRFNSPQTPPDAWIKDPAQIANKGDFALQALKKGGTEKAEGLLRFIPKDYFSQFQGLTNTPRKNKQWDYTSSSMTAGDSIYGALLWLADKKHSETITIVPSGEEIVAKSGFNYWNELKARGLINEYVLKPKIFVAETFKKYNPNHKGPTKVQIGQKIKLPEKGKIKVTLTAQSDLEAMSDYNGGGDPNYNAKITSKDDIRSIEF